MPQDLLLKSVKLTKVADLSDEDITAVISYCTARVVLINKIMMNQACLTVMVITL